MKSIQEVGFARASAAMSDGFREALAAGLARSPKSIPSKYFYDAAGARLFDEICTLPEYYLTRTETALLRAHAAEISSLAGPDVEIMEFGAGSGDKIRILLDAFRQPRAYVPVDFSITWLDQLANGLRRDYPSLQIHPVIGDFTANLRWPLTSESRRLGFFPGSTIGNFTPLQARQFLSAAAGILDGGALLIGVDLVKDPAILHAAYNDRAGITAAFNLNLLVRANRDAGANFVPSRFFHYAFYNPAESRIEMHLISAIRQTANVSGQSFEFSSGEAILTEYSYKYTVESFQEIAASSGFMPRKFWCDPDGLFSLHWLESR